MSLKSNKKWLGKGNKWVEKLWTDPYPNRSGLWYSALMPTVLRLGSLRVVIYPNDHRPAHVHVIGQGHRAVFILNCSTGPLSLRRSGFRSTRHRAFGQN